MVRGDSRQRSSSLGRVGLRLPFPLLIKKPGGGDAAGGFVVGELR